MDSLSTGRLPVLIALSRKMPRFIEWFQQIYSPNANDNFNTEILEKTEITTEIAIPFICLNEDTNDYDFIILDDLIIHGKTLSVTSELLFELTGRIPRMSCIAMLNSLTIRPNIEIEDFFRIPGLSQEEIDRFAEEISEIVEQYQLPVDMEFPVFTSLANDGFYDNLMSNIEYAESEIENSTRKCGGSYLIGNGKDKISIDLTISDSAGEDTDFSKVRFYKKSNDRFVFEVFSPMILAESLLTSEFATPFSDAIDFSDPLKLFEKLWQESTQSIRKHYNEIGLGDNPSELPLTVAKRELARSLTVWANYLFSFSTFIKNQCEIFQSYDLSSVELSKSDLTLLIGKSVANIVYPQLHKCMKEGYYVVSNRAKPADAPLYIYPEHLKKLFKSNKIIALIESDSVEEVAERIFKYMHYTNPDIVEENSTGRMNHNRIIIGETYNSLSNALIPFYMETFHTKSLHAWVDQQIDAGRIIPKYNRVVDSDGNPHWRRFFHAGIRKFKEFLHPEY